MGGIHPGTGGREEIKYVHIKLTFWYKNWEESIQVLGGGRKLSTSTLNELVQTGRNSSRYCEVGGIHPGTWKWEEIMYNYLEETLSVPNLEESIQVLRGGRKPSRYWEVGVNQNRL